MSILDWFAKKEKTTHSISKLEIPDDLWVKCFSCNGVLYLKDVEKNFKICQRCGYHFRVTVEERKSYMFDKDSFREMASQIGPIDFLKFVDTEKYEHRIKRAQKKTNQLDAVLVGTAEINAISIGTAIMDFGFLGGSMGSVVGEKITCIIEHSLDKKLPLVIFSSSGGARMQEGILSLMQMAKTSAALAKFHEAGLPYISVLCDPTTGGTSASFAMLGDVNIAEPGALVSFAGPRVIEQTIRQKLPPGFQRAEFLLEHGMLDLVTPRNELKDTLTTLLRFFSSQQRAK